jgi:hypothetical protein
MHDDWKKDVKELGKKLDTFNDRLADTEKHLAVYNEQLKIHIAGVKEAQRRNNLLEQTLQLEVVKFNKKLEPITSHVKIVNFVFRYMMMPIGLAMAIAYFKDWV